jgi:hypothetical protein
MKVIYTSKALLVGIMRSSLTVKAFSRIPMLQMFSSCNDPLDHVQLEECGEWLEVHLFSLSYGPNPEDWHVWFDNPVDEVVGEFWEMVEREEEIMPGTWVE